MGGPYSEDDIRFSLGVAVVLLGIPSSVVFSYFLQEYTVLESIGLFVAFMLGCVVAVFVCVGVLAGLMLALAYTFWAGSRVKLVAVRAFQ